MCIMKIDVLFWTAGAGDVMHMGGPESEGERIGLTQGQGKGVFRSS